MRHKHRVVARRVQLPIDRVMLRRPDQHLATLERDHLIDDVVPLKIRLDRRRGPDRALCFRTHASVLIVFQLA